MQYTNTQPQSVLGSRDSYVVFTIYGYGNHLGKQGVTFKQTLSTPSSEGTTRHLAKLDGPAFHFIHLFGTGEAAEPPWHILTVTEEIFYFDHIF